MVLGLIGKDCLTHLTRDDIPLPLRKHIIMDISTDPCRDAVDRFASQWLSSGLPYRQEIDRAADRLEYLREQQKGVGLWLHHPVDGKF